MIQLHGVDWNKPSTARRPLLRELGASEETAERFDQRWSRPLNPTSQELEVAKMLHKLVYLLGLSVRRSRRGYDDWNEDAQEISALEDSLRGFFANHEGRTGPDEGGIQ